MSTKRISEQKVNELSSLMVKNLSDKLIELKEKLKSKIEEILIDEYDQDLLDFFKQYPKFVKMCEPIYISYYKDGEWHYLLDVMVNLPKYPFEETNGSIRHLFKNAPYYILIEDIVEEYVQVFNKKKVLINKIRCTLESLKTYPKIKNEFPEAYKILIEVIDKQKFDSEDTCTNIEELRAELTLK